MIIAVDAAGGEYAPREIVKGALRAAQEYKIRVALVGNKTLLHLIAGKYLDKLNITIIEASQFINFNEHPMDAIRSKPYSSIAVGINLIKDGKADAFVSAGNTGAVLCAAILNLGKIEGVERPALGTVINLIPSTPMFLIDAGANTNCRPSHLVQFAYLGSVYAKYVLGLDAPRIGLLSNGIEEVKGNQLIQEAHKLLRKSGLKFIGNIEGIDIAHGTADVIVTDGLTGNIVLKTIEGLGDYFIRLHQQLGNSVDVSHYLKGRELLVDTRLSSLVKRLDYSEYGGACLLGVKGNVIVSHGRSQARAIKNAIGLAQRISEQRICQLIKEIKYD